MHEAFVRCMEASDLTIEVLQLDDGSQTHPNAEGEQLWAATEVSKALVYQPSNESLSQQIPTLATVAESLIPDPMFSDWYGASPVGWTATNATITKDTGNYQTGQHAMKIMSGAADGLAYAEMVFSPASLGIVGDVSGQVVTVAALMYAPTANSSTPALQHSSTPALQHSSTPALQHSRWEHQGSGRVHGSAAVGYGFDHPRRMGVDHRDQAADRSDDQHPDSPALKDLRRFYQLCGHRLHPILCRRPPASCGADSYVGGTLPDTSVWNSFTSDVFSGDGPVNGTPNRSTDAALGGTA